MLNEPTLQKLAAMRLAGMTKAWQEQQDDPQYAGLGFDERFGLIVDAEVLHSENRGMTRRLRDARLRIGQACLEDLRKADQRGLDRPLIRQLATCQWIAAHKRVLITGATGTGKTYVACALAQQACRKGHRTLYRRIPRLLDELTLARADGTYATLMNRFAQTDLMVLDDWGLVTLNDKQRRDLLELIEDRYGERATIITSQFPTSDWHAYLGEPTVADAIMDRLIHGAYKIALKGPSQRKEEEDTEAK
jgi:DNA replication protein DnaC